MPIDVIIDVIPRGDETARHQIGLVRIVQTEKLDDDPDGWRVYAVTGARLSTARPIPAWTRTTLPAPVAR